MPKKDLKKTFYLQVVLKNMMRTEKCYSRIFWDLQQKMYKRFTTTLTEQGWIIFMSCICCISLIIGYFKFFSLLLSMLWSTIWRKYFGQNVQVCNLKLVIADILGGELIQRIWNRLNSFWVLVELQNSLKLINTVVDHAAYSKKEQETQFTNAFKHLGVKKSVR